MNRSEQNSNRLKWIIPILLAITIVACGGKKTVLGPVGNPVLAPTVTAVTPVHNTDNVDVHNPAITATFNEPIIGGASFIVTCMAPCSNPTGVVTLDPTNKIVTFTPAANLAATTLYTATVDGAHSIASGLAQAHPYVWQFTTGIAPSPLTVTAVGGSPSDQDVL